MVPTGPTDARNHQPTTGNEQLGTAFDPTAADYYVPVGDQDRTFVFVQRSANEYEVRDVQIGESNGTLTSILGGLSEGEPVVTHGAFVLKSELMKKQV